MAETVDPVHSEDLLTSLRRLVADTQPEPLVSEAPQPSSRLVLTPSLRVATPPPAEEGAQPSPLILAAEDGVDTRPEPSMDTPADVPADLPVDAPAPDDIDTTPELSAESEQDTPTDDEPSFDDRRAQLEATIAELEVAVQDSDDQWEPDGSEAAKPALDWAQMERVAPDAEVLNVTAAMAALRAADGPADAGPADDTTAEIDEAPAPIDPSEDDAPEAATSNVEELHHATDDGLDEFAVDDLTTLDEEMLRDIIREVLHEELRGPLGERITRNLRKLTRREIYRILASEDLS